MHSLSRGQWHPLQHAARCCLKPDDARLPSSCRTRTTLCPFLLQGTPVSIVVTHMGLANADFVVRENR